MEIDAILVLSSGVRITCAENEILRMIAYGSEPDTYSMDCMDGLSCACFPFKFASYLPEKNVVTRKSYSVAKLCTVLLAFLYIFLMLKYQKLTLMLLSLTGQHASTTRSHDTHFHCTLQQTQRYQNHVARPRTKPIQPKKTYKHNPTNTIITNHRILYLRLT